MLKVHSTHTDNNVHHGISREEIEVLACLECQHALTLYVPTSRTGQDVQQGRIKLKNLLVEAENRLVEQGLRRTVAIDLLQPAAELDADVDFWNDRLDSVAIFLAPGEFQAHHLAFQTPESLHVGRHFYIRPLVQALDAIDDYFVLALDKGHVRLVRCSPDSVVEEPVPHLPDNFESFLALEHPEKQSQGHTVGPHGGAGTMIRHGSGDQSADPKERLHRFSVAIAKAVEDYLRDSEDPVVLAGTEDFQSDFRAVAHLKHLLDRGISRSPNTLTRLDLQHEAEGIVAGYADERRARAIEQYNQAAGTGLASQQLEDFLPFAAEGRVDVLLTYPQAEIWGTFDPGKRQLERTESTAPEAVELINEAAIATLKNGGTVFEIDPKDLDLLDSAAVIFRY